MSALKLALLALVSVLFVSTAEAGRSVDWSSYIDPNAGVPSSSTPKVAQADDAPAPAKASKTKKAKASKAKKKAGKAKAVKARKKGSR